MKELYLKMDQKQGSNITTFGRFKRIFHEIYNSTSTQTCVLYCTQNMSRSYWMEENCLYFICPLTNIRRIQPFYNVFSMKKWAALDGLNLWKLNSFLERLHGGAIEFTGEFLRVQFKILHLYASQTIGQFWAQCKVWSKWKVFVIFDKFSK